MPTYYEAQHRYAGERDGRTLGPWETGDAVTLEPGDLPWLYRDAPGLLDLSKPLTESQAGELTKARQVAVEDAAALDRERETAIRDHIRRHCGAWCMGRPSVRPHGLADLQAAPDGDGWLIGCESCLDWHTTNRDRSTE